MTNPLHGQLIYRSSPGPRETYPIIPAEYRYPHINEKVSFVPLVSELKGLNILLVILERQYCIPEC